MTRRTSPDFTLDEQLCFALYAASRAMTAAYRERLAGLGLTYTQYVVLLLLWEHDRMPMGELSRRLHLDSATLSPLVKRLERRGLVTRVRQPEDERVVEVACTADGRALRRPVRQIQRQVERETGLSRSELGDLRTTLHGVGARLREGLAGEGVV